MATREEEHLRGTCSLLLTTFSVYTSICKERVRRFLLSRCISIVLVSSGVYLEAYNFSIDSGATRLAIWPHARECNKNFNQPRVSAKDGVSGI